MVPQDISDLRRYRPFDNLYLILPLLLVDIWLPAMTPADSIITIKNN